MRRRKRERHERDTKEGEKGRAEGGTEGMDGGSGRECRDRGPVPAGRMKARRIKQAHACKHARASTRASPPARPPARPEGGDRVRRLILAASAPPNCCKLTLSHYYVLQ